VDDRFGDAFLRKRQAESNFSENILFFSNPNNPPPYTALFFYIQTLDDA
jgi:hypothetical protein